jgi:hypothetical protein
MKATDFKKMIKEAVREVFQEEMREILIEAVKSPKVPVGVPVGTGGHGVVTETRTTTGTVSEASRAAYRSMLGEMFNPNGAATFTTTQTTPAYVPPPTITTGEGSALPAGEVNLDQIMGLMNR